MAVFARLFCVFALAAFAVGAVPHSAGSAAMKSAMIAVDAGMTSTDDCDACGGSEAGLKGATCDIACSAPGIAAIPSLSGNSGLIAVSDVHVRLPEHMQSGIAAPRPSSHPDPNSERTRSA